MSGHSEDDEELIAELLIAWQESMDRRDPHLLESLCAERPDLLPLLRERIESLAQVDHLIERLSFQDDVQSQAPDSLQEIRTPEIPGYKILTELGRGGMGIVYKAVQERLNRIVAIKIVRGGRWVSHREIERFRSEAEVLAKIHHPGVVQIYDILEHEGLLCLILEFVNGSSLSESMRSRPVTPVEAAAIVHEVASVMSAVHAKGVLHRDIKPANILLQLDGRIKLTDFGIAKALASSSKQTLSGEVLGTPSYMAPELVLEKRELITVQTDVYAIGATLYELLTRRAPFGGTSVADTFHQITNDQPLPPQLFAARIPRDLSTICLKCLEKDPDRRYHTAALLCDDLDRFLHGRPILARPVSSLEHLHRWCQRNPEKAFFRFFSLLAVLTMIVGASWFTARLNVSHKEMSAKQEALVSEQFHARLNRLRAQSFVRPPGWLDASLAEVASLSKFAKTPLNRQDLRNEVLRLVTQHDVRHRKTLLTGADICRVAVHPTKPILALAENVSVDEKNVVIRLIDTTTYELIQSISFPVHDHVEFPGEVEGCRALVFSPCGADLFVGTRRGRVCQFKTDDWTCRRMWNAHADRVMGITIDDTTGTIYTCSRAGEIKGWEEQSDSESLREFLVSEIDGELFGLQYLNHRLIVCSGNAILHDLRNHSEKYMLDGPLQRGATCIRCPAGTTALVGCGPRLFQLKTELNHEQTYVIRELTDSQSPTPHAETVESLAVSHDGRFAASVAADAIKIWDFASGRPIRSISLGDGAGKAVQFLPDGRSFVVAGEGQVELYEISSNPIWKSYSVTDDSVTTATLTPDGELLFHAGNNSSQPHSEQLIRVDLQSLDRQSVVLPISQSVDEILVVGETTIVLNRAQPEEYFFEEFQSCDLAAKRHHLIGNDAQILALDPAENFIYFISDDFVTPSSGKPPSAVFRYSLADAATTICWSNVESAERLRKSQILAIAVGRDRFVTSARDGQMRIHAVTDGAVIASQPTDVDITCIKIVSDELLLCGNEIGSLQVRRLKDGAILKQFEEHHAKITCLEVADQGNKVITACANGYLQFWHFDRSDGTLTPGDRLGPLNASIRRISSSQDGMILAIVVKGEHATRILDMNQLEHQIKELGF